MIKELEKAEKRVADAQTAYDNAVKECNNKGTVVSSDNIKKPTNISSANTGDDSYSGVIAYTTVASAVLLTTVGIVIYRAKDKRG